MAWYRCGGGGIPSSLKGDMNDVFNKKFGTVLQDYPSEDWPGTVNLMGPLPERTVSGAVVAFSDGADAVKLKSCEVTIAPNLDGVSSVNVVSAGKNLIDISGTDPDNGYTDDRWLSSINAYNNNNDWHITEYLPILPNTDYTLSGIAYGNAPSVCFYDENKDFISGISYANRSSFTFTSPATAKFVRFSIRYDFTEFMMEYGSTATTYEPYVTPTTHAATLGRTIYGGEVDVVNGTGTDVYTFDLWDGTQNYNVSDNLTNVFRIYMNHAKPLPDPTAVQCICEGYTFPRAGWSSDTVSFYSDANNFTLKLPKTEVTTLAEAKAWLAQHNVTFLYATKPEDFTFTPVPIISRLGDNTLWGDGDLSVTYRRDIDLALAQ